MSGSSLPGQWWAGPGTYYIGILCGAAHCVHLILLTFSPFNYGLVSVRRQWSATRRPPRCRPPRRPTAAAVGVGPPAPGRASHSVPCHTVIRVQQAADSRQQAADSRISTELWIVAEPVRGQPGSSGFCQVILESMVFFTLAIQLSCVTLIKLKLIAS